jgi:hypothetical protein
LKAASSTASGQTVTHLYGTEGTFSVVLTVSSGGQAATAPGTAAAKSITGKWSEGTRSTISLTQNGRYSTATTAIRFRAWSPIPSCRVDETRQMLRAFRSHGRFHDHDDDRHQKQPEVQSQPTSNR